MATPETVSGLRPFHETIVEELGQVNDEAALKALAHLLLTTKIPKNHCPITATFIEAAHRCGVSVSDGGEFEQVTLGLHSQRVRAEKEEARKQEATKEELPAGTH